MVPATVQPPGRKNPVHKSPGPEVPDVPPRAATLAKKAARMAPEAARLASAAAALTLFGAQLAEKVPTLPVEVQAMAKKTAGVRAVVGSAAHFLGMVGEESGSGVAYGGECGAKNGTAEGLVGKMSYMPRR